MPKISLTPDQRRDLVLRGLAGESPTKLGREYGVTRSRVYALLEEARNEPVEKIVEAAKEHTFRMTALDLINYPPDKKFSRIKKKVTQSG